MTKELEERIRALAQEAEVSRDLAQVMICEMALKGDRIALDTCKQVLAHTDAQK